MMPAVICHRAGDGAGLVSAPGEGRWYALLARPGQDGRAVAALHQRRVAAWSPSVSAWCRVGGRRVRLARRVLPGYVVARFLGEPLWGALFGEQPLSLYLRGVVGMGDRPVPLSHAAVASLATMPGRAELLRDRHLREAARVVPVAGPYEGLSLSLEQIVDGTATVIVPLFGEDYRQELPVEWLRAEGQA